MSGLAILSLTILTINNEALVKFVSFKNVGNRNTGLIVLLFALNDRMYVTILSMAYREL